MLKKKNYSSFLQAVEIIILLKCSLIYVYSVVTSIVKDLHVHVFNKIGVCELPLYQMMTKHSVLSNNVFTAIVIL